jgi:hypothetical protein
VARVVLGEEELDGRRARPRLNPDEVDLARDQAVHRVVARLDLVQHRLAGLQGERRTEDERILAGWRRPRRTSR